jgi:y4mF family transcriptional regulator
MKTGVTESPLGIAKFVKARRIANRLSQRELGELAGVGTRLISELERGKPTIRMDVVNRVLAVFGQMLGPIEAPRSDEDKQ